VCYIIVVFFETQCKHIDHANAIRSNSLLICIYCIRCGLKKILAIRL